MDVLSVERDISSLPLPNQIWTVRSSALPPQRLITSAFVLAFDGGCFLATNLARRGWDIPGGHLEAGEEPEAAMRREVYEETGARLSAVRLLAHQRISLLGPVPHGYRYPAPDSYQVFYVARIAALDPFFATVEAVGRGLLPPTAARMIPWLASHLALYTAAVSALCDSRH